MTEEGKGRGKKGGSKGRGKYCGNFYSRKSFEALKYSIYPNILETTVHP